MPTLNLTAYEALAIERRLRDLARSGAFDSDDLAEPLRWALERLSAETSILDVPRSPRDERSMWRVAVDSAPSAENLEAYLRLSPPRSEEDARYAHDRFGRPWAQPASAS